MTPFLPGSEGFVPLIINNTSGSLTLPDLNRKVASETLVKNSNCEISYPNGVIVKLTGEIDAGLLQLLISLKV